MANLTDLPGEVLARSLGLLNLMDLAQVSNTQFLRSAVFLFLSAVRDGMRGKGVDLVRDTVPQITLHPSIALSYSGPL